MAHMPDLEYDDLTADQKYAVKHICRAYFRSASVSRVIVLFGEAGTGKSTVIHFVKKAVTHCYCVDPRHCKPVADEDKLSTEYINKVVDEAMVVAGGGFVPGLPYDTETFDKALMSIRLLATTGVAASNIGGTTLAAATGLGKGTKLTEPPRLDDSKPSTNEEQLKLWRSRQDAYDDDQVHFAVDKLLAPSFDCPMDIVDETSMAKVDHIRLFHKVCQRFRNNLWKNNGSYNTMQTAFGGALTVLVADPVQLAPVSIATSEDPREKDPKMVFEDQWFKDIALDCDYLCLRQNMRAQHDESWKALLGRMRVGGLTEEDIDKLNSRKITSTDNLWLNNKFAHDTMHVFTRNKDAREHNETKLAQIKKVAQRLKNEVVVEVQGTTVRIPMTAVRASNDGSETIVFDGVKNWLVDNLPSEISTTVTSKELNFVQKKVHALVKERAGLLPNTCVTKKGAKVMNVVNVRDLNLVNGDCGVVVGYAHESDDVTDTANVRAEAPLTTPTNPEERLYPVIQFERKDIGVDGLLCLTPIKIKADKNHEHYLSALPIMLAFGVTVHKCQGLTRSEIVVYNNGYWFAEGQAYVAFSRCQTLQGLAIKNAEFTMQNFKCNQAGLDLYDKADANMSLLRAAEDSGDDLVNRSIEFKNKNKNETATNGTNLQDAQISQGVKRKAHS